MANRERQYMDDLLGRNDEPDSRAWDGRDREYQGRFHRTQASRTRPRPTQNRSDYERDYSVRNRPSADYMEYNPNGTTRSFEYKVRENDDYSSFRDDDFYSERDRGFYGRGPKNWKWSDDRVKEQVSEALYRNYDVDASEIEVDVKDGVVTLTGSVDSRDAKRTAEACIENLNGVRDVNNRLRIADQNNIRSLS